MVRFSSGGGRIVKAAGTKDFPTGPEVVPRNMEKGAVDDAINEKRNGSSTLYTRQLRGGDFVCLRRRCGFVTRIRREERAAQRNGGLKEGRVGFRPQTSGRRPSSLEVCTQF